jgi:hypothetical protein
MIKKSPLLVCILIVTAQFLGCGGTDYALTDVKGRITRSNQPVEGANVTFQPIAAGLDNPNPGPGSFGHTDADGRYSLRTFDLADLEGAVVGRHRVTIRLPSQPVLTDASGEKNAPVVPPSFVDGSLIVEVPAAGLDNANFDLTKPPQK